MKRVSEKGRRILAAIQFHANASVPDISRRTGLPAHVIQYELQKLKREGVARPWALVDFAKLGWTEYELYFSLTAEGRKKRATLLRHLLGHSSVVWVGELGGEYHYLVTVLSRNVHDLSCFVDSLAERFGNIFADKMIVSLVSLNFFTKKYLTGGHAKNVEIVRLGHSNDGLASIDETDCAILSRFCTEVDASHRSIARSLGVPRTTVDYRVLQLEKRQIIAAYACRMAASHFGRMSFRFLIKTLGLGLKEREAIFDFCLRHPDIVNFFHCVGSWDIEITVEEYSSLPSGLNPSIRIRSFIM